MKGIVSRILGKNRYFVCNIFSYKICGCRMELDKRICSMGIVAENDYQVDLNKAADVQRTTDVVKVKLPFCLPRHVGSLPVGLWSPLRLFPSWAKSTPVTLGVVDLEPWKRLVGLKPRGRARSVVLTFQIY